MKRLLGFVLALLLVLSLTAGVSAVDTGTVSVKNATIGEVYSGYKILDCTYSADGAAVAYTIDSSSPWFTDIKNANHLFLVSQVGTSTLYNVRKQDGATDAGIIDWLNTSGILVGKTADLAEVTVTQDGIARWTLVPFGYYLITSSIGALVSVDSSTPNVTIIDKNQGPSWNDPDNSSAAGGKYIVEDSVRYAVADYGIGEVFHQEIEVNNATNWDGEKQIHTYTIADTLPTGMDIDSASVNVLVNGAALGSGAYSSTLAENKLTVTIPWVSVNGTTVTENYLNKSVVLVKYDAYLNEDAIVGNSGNTNKVNVSWNYVNVTAPAGDPVAPGTGKGQLAEMSTTVYTSGIKLKKVDSKDNTKLLDGAKFTITGENLTAVKTNGAYYKQDSNGTLYLLKDGTYTSTPAVTDKSASGYNADVYDSTVVKYSAVDSVTKDNADSITRQGYVKNGVLTVEGLKAGTYSITEVVSPKGYNILEQPISLVISFNDNDANPAFTATVDDAGAALQDNLFVITVENTAGTILPRTGGDGGEIFFVVGGALILAAGLVLIIKKRRS